MKGAEAGRQLKKTADPDTETLGATENTETTVMAMTAEVTRGMTKAEASVATEIDRTKMTISDDDIEEMMMMLADDETRNAVAMKDAGGVGQGLLVRETNALHCYPLKTIPNIMITKYSDLSTLSSNGNLHLDNISISIVK